MRVKIIKQGFGIDDDYFDFEGTCFRVISSLDNIRFDINYPLTYDISALTKDSEKSPIILDRRFVKKTANETDEQNDLSFNFPDIYIYKGNLYTIEEADTSTEDEKKLLIKLHYYKHSERLRKLQKAIDLFESTDITEDKTSREPIPEKVRFAVWRRDGGKCVQCGSNKNLEFDHIIPISEGGANTVRNLQLLCEKCNREKSNKI